jgi:hypothetical protein
MRQCVWCGRHFEGPELTPDEELTWTCDDCLDDIEKEDEAIFRMEMAEMDDCEEVL